MAGPTGRFSPLLRAILFDIDGVLAETEEVRRQTFNSVFAEAGLDWRWCRTVYADLLKSTGADGMIAAFVQDHVPRWRQTPDLGPLMSAMTRRQKSLYAERLEAGDVRFRPGVARFLRFASSEGIRLAIATQECAEHLAALLRANRTVLDPATFEVVATPSGAHVSPHESALSALELEPSRCLAVQSSVRSMRSALSAGLPSVITWGIYPQLQECGDALLANATSRPGSSVMLARWDEANPAEVLARLRSHHAAQTARAPSLLDQDISVTWSRSDKELDHAGIGYFEN